MTNLNITFRILAGRCEDLLILQPLMTSLICRFPCLLNLLPTNVKWSASFFPLSLLSVYGDQFQISSRKFQSLWTNNWQVSQETKEMSLGKWDICGGNPELTISLCVGRAGSRTTVSIKDAFKMQTGLMHVFEELHTAHCGKKGIWMAAAMAWPLLWAFGWPLMPN